MGRHVEWIAKKIDFASGQAIKLGDKLAISMVIMLMLKFGYHQW